MAITKVINVEVNTGDANQELDKLEGSFKSVDQAAEKTDNQLQKVGDNGGAIAVLDSLTGGLATRTRDAAEASKLFNLSLRGTRAALIATGIGAFVIALGLIVAHWDDIVDFITQANEKLENQLTLVQSIQGVLDAELATVGKQLELNKLQGKANEELEKQKVAILERLREQNEAEIKILENQLERLKATSTEVGFWETIKANVAFTLFGTKALASESANLAAQRLAEINELSTAIEQARLKEIDLAIQLFNIENPEAAAGEGREARVAQTGVNALTPQDRARLNSRQELNRLLEEEDKNALAIKLANEKQAALAEQQLAEQVKDAKIAIASNTVALIGQIATEGSELGKALAVAQVTLSSILGIQNIFTTASASPETILFPGFPFVQAGLAGIFGLKQINDILAVDPSGGSTPSGIGQGGGRPPSTPNFNIVAGSEGSQITEAINAQDRVSKAFVVSSDVSTSQSLERNIVENISL